MINRMPKKEKEDKKDGGGDAKSLAQSFGITSTEMDAMGG